MPAFHRRQVLSSEPEATKDRPPCREKDTLFTAAVWPLSTPSDSPVATAQMRTVVSYDPDISVEPSWAEENGGEELVV